MDGKKMQLSVAQKMVADYNENCGKADIHSFKIDADLVSKVIAQNGCRSLRIFVALENGLPAGTVGLPPDHTLVLVGVDEKGKNITFGEDDSEVYEQMTPCPVICDEGDGYTL